MDPAPGCKWLAALSLVCAKPGPLVSAAGAASCATPARIKARQIRFAAQVQLPIFSRGVIQAGVLVVSRRRRWAKLTFSCTVFMAGVNSTARLVMASR